MKKRIAMLIAIMLIIATASTLLVACNSSEEEKFRALLGLDKRQNEPDAEPESPYLPEYDEDGLFIEENFAYNMALEKENGITLIKDGTTEYTIVYQEDADNNLIAAASDLAYAFEGICGTKPTVVTDAAEPVEKEIVLGQTNRTFPRELNLDDFGAYQIATENGKIYITGKTMNGTENGIYGFIEDVLGCVFLNQDDTYYPSLKNAIVEPINGVWEPDFTYRDVGFKSTWNSNHFRNKLRSDTDAYSSDGCHHSLYYIDSDILAAHPEYYAEIAGERRTTDYMFQGPQLCFSNPDVIDLLDAAIMARAGGNKEWCWWDISQQDSMNRCSCTNCQALCDEYESEIAPMLYCLNIIANRHPDYKFSTLSYHYGSTPPKNVEIAPNLMIKWCIMSSFGRNDYAQSLSEAVDGIGKQQYEEIVGWSKLTSNLFVWDYITDYFNYILPFSCLSAMQGNMQLLRDCNVSGVLSLGSHNNRGSQDYLKANYTAHLLWDADLNSKEFIGKWLTAYFGRDVARYVLKMYMAEEEAVKSPLCVYDWPSVHKSDYLSLDNLNVYFGYLDEAYAAAGDDIVINDRLDYEKLSLLYAKLSLKYYSASELPSLKDEFVELCERYSIVYINEICTFSVADFVKDLK